MSKIEPELAKSHETNRPNTRITDSPSCVNHWLLMTCAIRIKCRRWLSMGHLSDNGASGDLPVAFQGRVLVWRTSDQSLLTREVPNAACSREIPLSKPMTLQSPSFARAIDATMSPRATRSVSYLQTLYAGANHAMRSTLIHLPSKLISSIGVSETFMDKCASSASLFFSQIARPFRFPHTDRDPHETNAQMACLRSFRLYGSLSWRCSC